VTIGALGRVSRAARDFRTRQILKADRLVSLEARSSTVPWIRGRKRRVIPNKRQFPNG
jgi:hypothetical protein